jgi:lysophospholipase L1-like esterase
LYVAADLGERGGLWRYDATGPEDARWSRLFDDKQILNIAVDPNNPNRLALTTNMDPYGELSLATGVWISGDAGKTWSQQNDGLAMLRGHAIAFDPFDSRKVVFGSFGRGFWKASWPVDFVPRGAKSYTTSAEDIAFANGRPPAIAVPRLSNGDMSEGDALPANWTTQWTGRGKLTATRDTTTYKSAPASLKVQATGDSMGQQVQSVEANPGATFTISGWMKSSGEVKVNFMLQPTDATWTPIGFVQIGYAQNESDWRQFTREITIPKDAKRANIGLLIEGTGSAWLDDVKISVNGTEMRAAPAPPLPVDIPAPEKVQSPVIASTRAEGSWPRWWYDLHKSMVARVRQNPDAPVIFFGDSITQFWSETGKGKVQWDANFGPLGALNFGIAGDKVQNVLWRVRNGELDGASPKLIVLNIGINNILGNSGSDAEIAQGTGLILAEFKRLAPRSRVLLIGILPALDKNADARRRITNINAELGKFQGENVEWLSINDKFLAPDGTLPRDLFPDWVHPSPRGYEIYAENLAPEVKKLLER